MGEEAFSGGKMKGAMEELMKSEEGRELASKIREKLKQLNDAYKDLSGDEKKNFLEDFRSKFSDSLGELTDSLKTKLPDSGADGSFRLREDRATASFGFYNNLPFILAVSFIVLVFAFFGRKLYRSIKEKETKKEWKPKKLLKKTLSPPASPQSRKLK